MGIITFLKKRYKKQLLKNLDNLKKLSTNYLENSEAYAKLIQSDFSVPCISKYNFSSCSFSSFMYNSYNSNLSDVFYNNYIHFDHMYHSTERKIKRIEKKLESI